MKLILQPVTGLINFAGSNNTILPCSRSEQWYLYLVNHLASMVVIIVVY